MSGIGGAVCVAAMSPMSAHLWGQAALELLEPTVLWRWLPGDAIGLVGAAGMQPTSVVADGACRTLVPMPYARRKLETNHQRLALKLYRYPLGAQFGQEPGDDSPPGPAGDRDPDNMHANVWNHGFRNSEGEIEAPVSRATRDATESAAPAMSATGIPVRTG